MCFSKYPPFYGVTATIILFHNGKFIYGTRADNAEVYPGHLCVPGGFIDPRHEHAGIVIQEGETVEEAAIREIYEECGIEIDGDQLILFHEHSKPDTDPRGHVVNLCYIVNITDAQFESLKPGSDLKALDAASIHDLSQINGNWAFNHFDILRMAVLVWRCGGDYFQAKGIWA